MTVKPGRNDTCPCGSGKKYKFCCMPGRQPHPAAPSVSAEGMLQSALAYHRAGRLDEARRKYAQVLEREPAHADALHLYGLAWQAGGDLGRAAEMMEQAVRHCPGNAVYCVDYGVVLQQLGKPEAAEFSYRQAIAARPDHAEAHNNLGNVLKDQGRLTEALASYREALALLDEPVIHYNLANLLQETAAIDEAVVHYRRALELRPDYPEALGNLGSALQQLGQLEEAAACYRRALASQSGFAEAHNNLGNVLKDLGQLEEAERCYRAAIALRPYNPGMQNNLGNVLKAMGKTEEAMECYQRAVFIHPEHFDAWCNLGALWQQRGNEAEAIAAWKHALALQPASVEVLNNLGCALHAAGGIDEAMELYRTALALQPDCAELQFNLASTLHNRRMFEAALTGYREAIRLKPDYAEAHNNLGNALKEMERYELAETCYLEAIRLRPQAVEALCNLAILYSLWKRTEDAEIWYRRVLDMRPQHITANRNLAAILANDGRLAQARQYMDTAYRQKCWFHEHRYGVERTVLILLGSERGNVPFEHLFPRQRNNTIEWIVEYDADPAHPSLPDHDLVFNAMGEPDMTSRFTAQVDAFLRHCRVPVLNLPAAVARTARDQSQELFDGIPGLVIPRVWRLAADAAPPLDVQWPVLARPAGSHGGEGLLRVDSAEDLNRLRTDWPGREFYLTAWHDYRSRDGFYRKYRLVFVDGKVFPYHLAISPQWMVHYATAGMLVDWKLEEEQRFLEDPQAVFGERGMAAMAAIGQRMNLDFAGADVSLLPDGRVLLFEANATMLVHPEREQASLMFKNRYVQRIYDAFDAVLERQAGRRVR